VGDLATDEARRFHGEAWRHLVHLAGVTPRAVAHDLHPDFPSTRAAAESGLRTIAVQHHHAHLAAVAAEHGHKGPLLGLALDGVGFGPDGTIWGGELMDVDGAGYRRLARLSPLPQPGGDRAAREPWRMAAAALFVLGRGEEIAARFKGQRHAASLAAVMERRINTPDTSSLGRMFDAAAGLLGVATHAGYEAEAAMRLEALVRRPRDSGAYTVTPRGDLDLAPLFAVLTKTRDAQVGADVFHGTVAAALAQWLGDRADAMGRCTVALGGGCLLNRPLRDGLIHGLEARGLEVLTPRAVPPGDGGLSLGQAWVAAHALEGG
jgi:hydrogenase maturation protein HypF